MSAEPYPPRCEHCGSAALVIRPNQSRIVPGRPVRLRVYCTACGALDWIER